MDSSNNMLMSGAFGDIHILTEWTVEKGSTSTLINSESSEDESVKNANCCSNGWPAVNAVLNCTEEGIDIVGYHANIDSASSKCLKEIENHVDRMIVNPSICDTLYDNANTVEDILQTPVNDSLDISDEVRQNPGKSDCLFSVKPNEMETTDVLSVLHNKRIETVEVAEVGVDTGVLDEKSQCIVASSFFCGISCMLPTESGNGNDHSLTDRANKDLDVIDVDLDLDKPVISGDELDVSFTASVVKREQCDNSTDILSTPSPLPLMRDYCFCPHGFISHSQGHFHCRQCGESFKFLCQVNRHEKSHKELMSSFRNTPSVKTESAVLSVDSFRKLDCNVEMDVADVVHSSDMCYCSNGFVSHFRRAGHHHCNLCGFASRYQSSIKRHIIASHSKDVRASVPHLQNDDCSTQQSHDTKLSTKVIKSGHDSDPSNFDTQEIVQIKKEPQHEDFLTASGARRLCKCVRGCRKNHGYHYHCQYCKLSYRTTQSMLHHEKMVHNNGNNNNVVHSNSQNTSCSDSNLLNTNCDVSYCSNQEQTTLDKTADVSMCSGLDSVTNVSMNDVIDSVTGVSMTGNSDSVNDVNGGLDSITNVSMTGNSDPVNVVNGGLDSITNVSMTGNSDPVNVVNEGLDSITDPVQGIFSNFVPQDCAKNGVKYKETGKLNKVPRSTKSGTSKCFCSVGLADAGHLHCPLCDTIFPSRTELTFHVSSVHISPGGKSCVIMSTILKNNTQPVVPINTESGTKKSTINILERCRCKKGNVKGHYHCRMCLVVSTRKTEIISHEKELHSELQTKTFTPRLGMHSRNSEPSSNKDHDKGEQPVETDDDDEATGGARLNSGEDKKIPPTDSSQEHCLCHAEKHSHYHCSYCQYISRYKFAINRHNIKQHGNTSASPSGSLSYTTASLFGKSAAEARSASVEPPRKKVKYNPKLDNTRIAGWKMCEERELEGAPNTGNASTTDAKNRSFKTLQSETVNCEGKVEPFTELHLIPVASRMDENFTAKIFRSKNKKQNDRLAVQNETGCAQNKVVMSKTNKRPAFKVVIDMNGEERTEEVAPYCGPVVIPKASKTGKKLPCPLCNHVFVRVETLRNHLGCAHDILVPGQSWFNCVPCKFVTSYRYLFASHRLSLLHLSVIENCKSSHSTVSPSSEVANESRVGQIKLSVKGTDVLSNIPMSAVDESSTNVAALTPARSTKRQRLLNAKSNRIKWFYCGIPSTSTACLVIGSVGFQRPQILWNNTQHTCTANCLPHMKTPVKKISGKTSIHADKQKQPDKSSRTLIPKNKHPENTGKALTFRKFLARKSTTRPPRRRPSKAQSVIDVEILSNDSIDVESIESDDVDIGQCSTRVASVTGTRNYISGPKSRAEHEDDSDLEITSVEPGQLTHQTQATPSSSLTSLFSSPQSSVAASFSLPLLSYLFPNLVGQSCQVASDSHQSSVTALPSAVDKPVPPLSHVVASSVMASSTPSKPSTPSPSVSVDSLTRGASVVLSLDQFAADDLWCELSRRGRMRSCPCGVNFMDVALYLLHRSCHSSAAPLKCAFCNHNAASCYDFHGHLLDHKK